MSGARELCLLLALGAFFPWNAHAYVDPGSGHFFLQMLMAAGFGALFYIRQFRDFIFSLFSKAFGKKNNDKHE